RRFAELLFFDVEQGAEVLADALALLDADALVGPFGYPAVGPIDDDAQHRADRLTPQLDVENVEPMARRHSFGGGPNPRQPLSFHCLLVGDAPDLEPSPGSREDPPPGATCAGEAQGGGPEDRDRPRTRPKKKKWAQ